MINDKDVINILRRSSNIALLELGFTVAEIREIKGQKIPQPKSAIDIDWSSVRNMAIDIVNDHLENSNYSYEDSVAYLYEEVIKTVYSEDIFDILND